MRPVVRGERSAVGSAAAVGVAGGAVEAREVAVPPREEGAGRGSFEGEGCGRISAFASGGSPC